ncbi:murein biosynthesis integral membrane protein MurJ [Kineococcus sp. SYSU DK005]|uniref:murein biosynthesis integral membrane protein MurJ n=1 Tax=Kineococcus sp. SYSU DK005 TaxID=3383126 RepID=UPI003D7DA862
MSTARRPAPAVPPEPPAHEDARDSVARSSALMASGTLVSRLLGFVRTAVQGAALGAGAQVGAVTFDVANKAPNVFYMLLAGGVLNAVLVPQIVRALKRPDGGADYVNRLVTLSLVLMAAATVLLTAAAPLVVRLYASQKWEGDWVALATAMAYWCLPQVFFYGLYTVLGQVLNAKGRFGAYMWAPVLNNVVAVAGLVVFLVVASGSARQWSAGDFDPSAVAVLAGTSTLGIVVQALVLFWPLHRAGFRYRPRWGFRGVGLRSAGRVAGWTFAAVVAGQLVFVATTQVTTAAAAELDDLGLQGATNASYTPAFLLFMLPHSLVAVSLVTALFTRLSASAAAGDTAAVRRDFSYGARTVLVAGVLATAALVTLGPQIGVALFPAGDGRFVGQVVAAMAVGLVPFSVTYLVQRVFYAYEDARTPFTVSLVVALVMAAGDLVCWLVVPAQWKVVGVGVAMSASNAVGVVLGLVLLRRRLRSLDGRGLDGHRLLRTLVRALVVGALSGGAAHGVTRLAAPLGGAWAVQVGTVVVGGLVLLVLFTALCRAMRVSELDALVGPLLRRLPLPGRR